jgi:hypothetical protein
VFSFAASVTVRFLAPLHRTSTHYCAHRSSPAPPAKLLGSGWARCLSPVEALAHLGNGVPCGWWVFRGLPKWAWSDDVGEVLFRQRDVTESAR